MLSDKLYHPNQPKFVFTYSGSELAPMAVAKALQLDRAIKENRKALVDLAQKPESRGQQMQDIQDELSKQLQKQEECFLLAFECSRDPSREFNLNFGDLAFFNVITIEHGESGPSFKVNFKLDETVSYENVYEADKEMKQEIAKVIALPL